MEPAALEAPVQLLVSHSEPAGNGPLNAIRKHPPFLAPFTYSSPEELLTSLSSKVIDPPEQMMRGGVRREE